MANGTTQLKVKKKAKRTVKSLMKNLVGHSLPSEAEVQKTADAVEGLIRNAGKFSVALTPDQRKEAHKSGFDGAEIIALTGRLAIKYGAVIPNMSVVDMQNDALLVTRVRPLVSTIKRFLQLVTDTLLQGNAECWWAVGTYYGILDQMSAADATLRSELEPIRAWFATGARNLAATDPTPAPTPAATPLAAPAANTGH